MPAEQKNINQWNNMKKNFSLSPFPVLLTVLLLTACGGGGGAGGAGNGGTGTPHNPGGGSPGAFPASYAADGQYQVDGLPKLTAADMRHMPVYGDDEALFVGFAAANLDRLTETGTRGDSDIRHGRRNNGVGSDRVAEYLTEAYDEPGEMADRYKTPPEIRVLGSPSEFEYQSVLRAVQLLNASLPESAKLEVSGSFEDRSLKDVLGPRLSYVQIPRSELDNYRGAIQIEFLPDDEFAGTLIIGKAFGDPNDDFGYVVINREHDEYLKRSEDIVIHEIIHALTGFGHVTDELSIISAPFHGSGPVLTRLAPIDREALQVLHRRLDTGDDPTDFGAWASSSLVISGHNGQVEYGVSFQNGYFEPWASGWRPDTDLSSNRQLTGTAVWNGELLGLTPGSAAIAGDATIRVRMSTLSGSADFANLETWGANQAPGQAGSGTMWGDGALGYDIAVTGNTFRETAGSDDEGRLSGIFVGNAHEGAGGVLERDDFTAAFGAKR